MRKNFTVPASKPRNRVVNALIKLALVGAGRHGRVKRGRDRARKDIDQRVREIGEW